MACPYFADLKKRTDFSEEASEDDKHLSIQSDSDLTYNSYLQLDKILSAQGLRSALNGRIPIHDEHLFKVTHQTIELWICQIIHELDSIRNIFMAEYLEERNSLCVISRLNRIVSILKLISDHFGVLQSMTPQDFLDFRDIFEGASGFQSLQFRMLEIKLGVIDKLRVAYNRKHFMNVFFGEDRKKLEKASSEPSLLNLVNDWLSRTPGLKTQTFSFWRNFKVSVDAMLMEMKATAEDETNPQLKELKLHTYEKNKKNFDELFDEKYHRKLLENHERRFTYQALQGALMIFFYRDEPRFHLPFQVLHSLMDLDSQFMKVRHNHTSMVQRMVGSKVGTGGSSGYLYLRSTCSDRYKIFLDLLNMATYLVPRDRIPPLNLYMKKSLSLHDGLMAEQNSKGDSGSVYSCPINEVDQSSESLDA